MFDDDVLAGVRAAREAFAAAHDYDLEKMVAYLKARNEAEKCVVVRLPGRKAIEVVPAVAVPAPILLLPVTADS